MSRQTASGVPPSRPIRSSCSCSSAGGRPPCSVDVADDRVAGALAVLVAVDVDPAHPGFGGEGDEVRLVGLELALADPVLLGEDDDRAALGRLVGERGELRRLGQLGLLDPRHRDELRRLAVAERDRAGLVEQQHVDVAGRLDRPSGEGEHVVADEAVHAGDPDRREQGADRGRDQRHQQRDQGDDRGVGAGELGEGAQRDDDGEEDEGEPGEQDVEGDLVRRLAPLGPLDQGDHPVEEALPGLLGDLDDDPVGEDAGAAGDGAAIAARLAHHRRRLAGDRRLVDRGDALDHGAVAGDRLPRLDHDDVAAVQLRGRLLAAVAEAGDGLGAHRAQRVGLRLAPSLGDRLGEVGEDDGEPEPDADREGEPGGLVATAERRPAEDLDQPTAGDDHRADLDHEHDRVADLVARIELAQRVEQGARA